MDDPGTQVSAPFLFDQARAELSGHIGHTVFLEFLENRSVDGLRLAGHGERSQAGRGIVRPFGVDRAKPLCQRLGDFARLTRCPDAGTIDATAAAVQIDAVHHQVQIPLPLVHHVVAEEDFAETGAVDLHARIAVIALHRLGAAEYLHPRAAVDHFGAHFTAAGINADRFARHAGLEKRGCHAIRRPRLLRPGLEHEADLHRDNRHPERVNPGRVGRKHQTEHRRLRLVTHRDTARFQSVTAREDFQVQAARKTVEDALHVREHEMVFRHVGRAHVFGQTGRGGLLAREIGRRLLAVPHGQGGVAIEVGRLLHQLDQVAARDFAEHVAGALRFFHVPGEQTGISLAHLGECFTCDEVDDLVEFEALVRLAPAKDGNFDHTISSNSLASTAVHVHIGHGWPGRGKENFSPANRRRLYDTAPQRGSPDPQPCRAPDCAQETEGGKRGR